jgi:adenosine deaminase
VTVNSDDPAYFGGYVNENYLKTFEALDTLGAAHAHRLALNSLQASFAPETEKRAWIARLDELFAR